MLELHNCGLYIYTCAKRVFRRPRVYVVWRCCAAEQSCKRVKFFWTDPIHENCDPTRPDSKPIHKT